MKKIAIVLGNLFEHYDTALFSFLAPVLSSYLFPNEDELNGLILIFAIHPLSKLAKPIGALLFGLYGDFFGKEKVLSITLLGMGMTTFLFALLPSFQKVGFLAPLLFLLCRLLQNFFAGGETTLAALSLIEEAPAEKKDFLSGVFSSSTIGGILLASFLVTMIEDQKEGFRILYLLGSFVAFFGVFLRKKEISHKSSFQGPSRRELFSFIELHKREALQVIFVSAFSYVNYLMSIVLFNSWIPLVTTMKKSEVHLLNTSLLVLDFLLLPLFGRFSRKVGRERLMQFSALFLGICVIPCFFYLEGASLPLIIFIRVLIVSLAVSFAAPYYSWSISLMGKRYRALILSLCGAIGAYLASPISTFSLWIFQKTKEPWLMALPWSMMAFFIVLTFMKKMSLKASYNR